MAVAGRLYTVGFQNVSVSAVQDLITLIAGATKILAVQSVNIGQITGTTVSNLRVRLRYLPVTLTAGSGGSTPTPRPMVPGDAAATATAHANDTSQATTSGTAVDIWEDVFNTVNGFLWVPPVVGRPPVIGLSGGFVVSLDTAPGSAMTMNATVIFEELP